MQVLKNNIFFVIGLFFISGIGRDDVKPEKYLELAKQKQFDCVGQVVVDGDTAGSCVLICESTLLSAAHVFILSDTRPDTMMMDGQKVVVFTSINERPAEAKQIEVVFDHKSYKIKRLAIHPDYFDTSATGSSDLALIELEQSVKDIAPAILNENYDELGSEVVGVGYGVMAKATEESVIDFKKKNAGQNTIDSIGGKNSSGLATELLCDFDHPSRNDCNKMGSFSPLPLEYLCNGGDSGGGLFRKKGDKWVLVGICSAFRPDIAQLEKTGFYGSVMGWTRVSVFKDWIEEKIIKPDAAK